MKFAAVLAFVAWAALLVGAGAYRSGGTPGLPLLGLGILIAAVGGVVLGTIGIGLFAGGGFGIFEGMRQWGRGRRVTGAVLEVAGSSAVVASILLLRQR
jgi:hypothetical protein